MDIKGVCYDLGRAYFRLLPTPAYESGLVTTA